MADRSAVVLDGLELPSETRDSLLITTDLDPPNEHPSKMDSEQAPISPRHLDRFLWLTQQRTSPLAPATQCRRGDGVRVRFRLF
jgi:hypothetical protein